MPNTVAGQSFHVVRCQSCETDLSFQKAQPARWADDADELELTCGQCGHLGSYSTAELGQSQAQYPL